jgi:hypothetical protein
MFKKSIAMDKYENSLTVASAAIFSGDSSKKILNLHDWSCERDRFSTEEFLYCYVNFKRLKKILDSERIESAPVDDSSLEGRLTTEKNAIYLTSLQPNLNDFQILKNNYDGNFDFYPNIKWAVVFFKKEVEELYFKRLVITNDDCDKDLWTCKENVVDLKKMRYFVVYRS